MTSGDGSALEKSNHFLNHKIFYLPVCSSHYLVTAFVSFELSGNTLYLVVFWKHIGYVWFNQESSLKVGWKYGSQLQVFNQLKNSNQHFADEEGTISVDM